MDIVSPQTVIAPSSTDKSFYPNVLLDVVWKDDTFNILFFPLLLPVLYIIVICVTLYAVAVVESYLLWFLLFDKDLCIYYVAQNYKNIWWSIIFKT